MTRKEYKEYISCEVFGGQHRLLNPLIWFWLKMSNPQKAALYYIRKMLYYGSKTDRIHILLSQRLHMKLVQKFGVHISPNAHIGIGLHLPHPTGIVIGNCVTIGKNCSIYQGCTIGGARLGDVKMKNQPVIGNNCVIFSGSMVLGNIHVADGCVLAANSVLLEDAQEEGVYAGSPAKKVK